MYSDGEMGPDASDTGRLSLDLPMVENCEMVMLSRFIALSVSLILKASLL